MSGFYFAEVGFLFSVGIEMNERSLEVWSGEGDNRISPGSYSVDQALARLAEEALYFSRLAFFL
jgi:hypothetical protein